MMTPSVPLAVIILTYNEAKNLEQCLASVAGWTDQVFVVDSGSSDATLMIAQRYGAQAVHHSFETHARQWLWALRNLPLTPEWVLCLDADQRITTGLRRELEDLFTTNGSRLASVNGFYIKRRQVFRGRWIKHGGYYPKYLLKLGRRRCMTADERDVLDHHFYVTGAVGKLRGDIVEENRNEDDISFWIEKHVRYASLLALEEVQRRRAGGHQLITPLMMGTPDQRVLWRKHLWSRLPLYVRPFLYFVYRYVVRLGFLDGKQGLIFHFLHGCWFRLLVDIHVDEVTRPMSHEARHADDVERSSVMPQASATARRGGATVDGEVRDA